MIISHKHKYLFVEIPLTASWSIRHELCEYYDGVPILHKHATYPEFRRIPDVNPNDYFVFGTVRNPLEKVVSRYFKLANDHRDAFSDPDSAKRLLIDYSDYRKYRFVRSGATFSEYFMRFYRYAYSDLIDVASDRYDFVIRFEKLQDDFSAVLRCLGIDQVGPIPTTNRTQGKERLEETYYTEEMTQRASQVFGPFMRKWKYECPIGWDENSSFWRRELEYRLLSTVRMIYITKVRYNQGPLAQILRRMRSIW